MFSSRRSRLPWALALVLALAGCRRSPSTGLERFAVLPFDNATAEPAFDWLARATPQMLVWQLMGSRDADAFPVAAPGEARARHATRLVHGRLERKGGRLRYAVQVEDLGRRRILRDLSSGGELGEGLAGLLSAGSRAPATRSQAALRALLEGDAKAALEADPDFGPARVALAQQLAARGDSAGALETAAGAAARPAIPELERAELAVLSATLRGDRAARLSALERMARARPGSADTAQVLAEALISQRQFRRAAETYQAATRIDPSRPELFNGLGYAWAGSGDLEQAQAAIRQYAALAPGDPNSSDSLGEIHYLLGRFPEAETAFLDADRRSPGFQGGSAVLKAAWARRFSDPAAADLLFGRYLEIREKLGDRLIACRRAQWDFASGRRRKAAADLERFAAGAAGDAATHAFTILAIQAAMEGDSPRARGFAERASAASASPAAKGLAATVSFVTQEPASAAEWALRAERAFPDGPDSSIRRSALAYALLLNRHFREASPLLSEFYDQTYPFAAGHWQALLAWSLVEQGRMDEARALTATWPLPAGAGEPPFGMLAFPRFLETKARLLDRPGQKEESGKWIALYSRLAK